MKKWHLAKILFAAGILTLAQSCNCERKSDAGKQKAPEESYSDDDDEDMCDTKAPQSEGRSSTEIENKSAAQIESPQKEESVASKSLPSSVPPASEAQKEESPSSI